MPTLGKINLTSFELFGAVWKSLASQLAIKFDFPSDDIHQCAQPRSKVATASEVSWWKGMLAKALAVFDQATVRRSGKAVLKNLKFSINPGQAYVVIGPLGAGKSTLLSALHGDLPAEPAQSLTFSFLGQSQWPNEATELLTSKSEISNGSAYYAERYHSRREDDFTLREWLVKDMKDKTDNTLLESVTGDLQLSEFLDSSIINLSNGQSKRSLIARSLLKQPRVLLLDEPYVGLDVAARQNLSKVLGRLYSRGFPHIVMALRPLDDIPDWTTHILWLNADGSVRQNGTAADLKHFISNEALAHSKTPAQVRPTPRSSSAEVVRLEKVKVSYWGKDVLKDVSWTIRSGEKWHLSGSNGSGKTTLLAMILGDHPKIYMNEIHVFGRPRGSGETVFEIQAQMGHSSPEIHRHFPRYLTGQQCLASAFAESFYPKAHLTSQETALIKQVAAYFQVEDSLATKLSDMTPAMQRLFLLLQALVKKPKLVVLDEPFAGMDANMIEKARAYIDEEMDPEQSLIFVTHYSDEVPDSVNRHIKLDRGLVVEYT